MSSELTNTVANTIEQFSSIVCVHRNGAHFIYIYVHHTNVFEAENICKNSHKMSLLSKIWRWAFHSSRYLEKSKSCGEFAIYLIIYMVAMLVFHFPWSMGVFHYLI